MSLSRRFFLAAGGLALGALIPAAVQSQEVIADLETQLKSKLKARRPEDFVFINLVVVKVEQGVLPRSVVNAAFNWALKKHQPFPYPYFEEAMKRLARNAGVDLGPPASNGPTPPPP